MGAYTLLQDLTVSTNSTSVVLNDFGTITKDDFVKIEFTNVKTSTGGTLNFHLNNESAQTNYHSQRLVGFTSVVLAVRENSATLHDTENNGSNFYIGFLKLSENNRANLFLNSYFGLGTSPVVNFVYYTSSGATFANGITSLTINSTVSNEIAAGSRIQIYKLAATKVADITVASNTTQVDISNLSIDKDSEYLLVSDISANVNNTPIYLTPNDLTTQSGYYAQRIQGANTSAVAQRNNDSRVFNIDNKTLAYTYIKLSNIGAYTHQSYNINNTESSTLVLQNFFTSSTAENITSITKLNIIAENANAIGVGSRFHLYKLYE